VAAQARSRGYNVTAVGDLQAATRQADIISCCTLSRAPLVRGAWVQPGTHMDLIGAFKPEMRETDGAAVRASSVFVDTRGGALSEGGDIVQAIAEGEFSASQIQADLFDLCREKHPGRCKHDEITMFKSVGTALEDLAAATIAYKWTATKTN